MEFEGNMSKNCLQEILESAGYSVQSYSGRGMYGKNCLGVDVSNLGKLFADVLKELDLLGENGGGELEDDSQAAAIEDLATAFEEMRTDSLGRGMIVYFPEIDFDGGDEEEADDDSE
jgi:hypothetical protein